MNSNVEGLKEAVQENLKALSSSLDRLGALIDEREFTSEGELRKGLAGLEMSSKRNRERLSDALSDFDKWTSEEFQTRGQIDTWKAKRETSRLHSRADLCERCATAALEIAALAVQEAECAALRAVLARKEAVSVQVRGR